MKDDSIMLDKEIFNIKEVAPLNDANVEYAVTHYRGLSSEIESLISFFEKNKIRFETVSIDEKNNITELKTFYNRNIVDTITKFPTIRMTGLRENFRNSRVEVWFSESGFSVISKIKDSDRFEGHDECGSGRWAYECDMMKSFSTSYIEIHTGGKEYVDYYYPFSEEWNRNSGFVFSDGENFFTFEDSSDKFEILNGRLEKYNGYDKVIEVPDSVVDLGLWVFKDVIADELILPGSIKNVYLSGENRCIKKVVIRDGAEGIEGIKDWTVIESIELPDTVKVIKECAFSGCRALKEVNLPRSLEIIGDGAFYKCDDLRIDFTNLPENLVSIAGLISFAEEHQMPLPDIITSKNGTVILYQKPKKIVEIPEGVKEIGCTVFGSANNIVEELVIPESVEKFHNSEFCGTFGCCRKVRKVTLPGNMKIIPDDIFGGFNSLTQIEIPDNVTNIGNRAFFGCDLKDIRIPDSVEIIGESAFRGNNSLKAINLPKDLKNLKDSALDGLFGMKILHFPDGMKMIGGNLFNASPGFNTKTEAKKISLKINVEIIIIPDSVTEIGEAAFAGCHKLKKIYIPGSVGLIPNYAFWGCESLEEVVIGEGITDIGSKAFAECPSLRKVYFCGSIERKQKKPFDKNARVTLYGKEQSMVKEFAEKNLLNFCMLPDEATMMQIIQNVKADAELGSKQSESYQNAAGFVGKAKLLNPGKASAYAIQLVKSISDQVTSIEWADHIFVHTTCSNEEEIDNFINSKGGVVKSSTVLKTDYLIIGNNIDHETVKISRARELNQNGKHIMAMTESEFWSFAANKAPASVTMTEEDLKKEEEEQKKKAIENAWKDFCPSVGDSSESAVQLARSISNLPDKIEISDKTFKTVMCDKTKLIEYLIKVKGGKILSTVSKKLDYIILGDNLDHEHIAVFSAKSNNSNGSNIQAMTESEFLTICKGNE